MASPDDKPVWVPVLGGSLHGQRVRWQGPTIRSPQKRVEVFGDFIREADRVEPTWPKVDEYQSYDTPNGVCYIELGLARYMEKLRKRQERLAILEEILVDIKPLPHKLTTPYMKGYVWWCMDEHCDCYQACIDGWDYVEEGWRRGYQTLWRGTFHTDGESEIPYQELRACREWLDLIAPGLVERIRWIDIDES